MRAKPFGFGSLLLLLVLVLVFVPMILRFVGYGLIQPFQDVAIDGVSTDTTVSTTPSLVQGMDVSRHNDTYGTEYDMALPCRADANGNPCPEGTFCDGLTRSCVPISAPITISDPVGYYA
jgi:hypothetical protein